MKSNISILDAFPKTGDSMRILLLLATILLLTGCNPSITNPVLTVVPPTLNSQFPQPSQGEHTAAITVQAPKETQPQWTSTVLVTEIPKPGLLETLKARPAQVSPKSLCPSDGFVSVKDLGIPPKLGLLLTESQDSVSESEVYPLFIYQPAARLPGKPLSLKFDKTHHSLPLSSPDGRFFYYEQYDKGQPARQLVVQSADDQTREIVLEREYPFGYPSWIDNEHIIWMDIPDPENYWTFGGSPHPWDYIPTHLIDVQTLETQELPVIHFPKKDGQYTVQDFIYSATGNYAFLQHANSDQVSYEIYSYATQTSQPVFTWLPVNFLRDLKDTRTNITTNGRLYFIALDGNFFWITSQMSVAQVLSGADALAGHLYGITFPEAITPSFMPYYFDTRNAFLYTHESMPSKDILETVPQNLYRFDVDSQTVYDYCLDIQKWRGRGSMFISPDEEFAAITFYQNPKTGSGKKDTVLINLSTGDRTLLSDYQIFSWVIVNQ